jgi:hypothetical protein
MNIWPWSTIRRLRDALADAKREATLWETSYERRAQAYDEVVMQRMNLMGQLAAAEQSYNILRTQLAEAAKNDSRDPKTGRFVKAER